MSVLPFTALMTLCVALMSAQSTVSESTYIRYPNETSVWYWGYRYNVSWDNTLFILGAIDPSVNLYKGDSDTGYVLAQGFNLTNGHVEVTVPSVEADSDYVIRLFYVPPPHSATASSTAPSTSTVVSSHTSSIHSSPATAVSESSSTTTAAPVNNRAATSSEYLRGNSFTILQSPSPSTTIPLPTSTDSASATSTADAEDVLPPRKFKQMHPK